MISSLIAFDISASKFMDKNSAYRPTYTNRNDSEKYSKIFTPNGLK